ncbi:MAG: helix-turn-helix domain-containing protein [Pseudomonadales bacterium]|jgi:excisionase family DNA binding protein|nr:helix-turn-helix domain-containing protein [Pseudomonadales bacterium]MDP7360054.1 helix-turn-helix domain-containing protein [Pseudomonadales bacterium]MDP7598128.1 helix-turn-helix domain-containing protein [Pseudomonadales bacterium]HJN49375.1 helix-turn-helix domain-containing protein [Pseudomonadales bacterium]|tara:strand:+ start:647 stop:961 length:315 start_codon:yes stop_codon:yes gene_type:complete
MKIYHDAAIDFLSIDFTDDVEDKSVYEDGIIVRYNRSGHVIGIDITDSLKLFAGSELLTLRQVCEFLGVSESTIRRRIRNNKIKFIKEGNQYRFKKSDIIGLVA